MRERIEVYRKAEAARRKAEAPLIAEVVRTAHYFSVSVFRMGGYLSARADSLALARQDGQRLEAEASNGRKAIVYAISPQGYMRYVPAWFEESEDVPPARRLVGVANAPRLKRDGFRKNSPGPRRGRDDGSVSRDSGASTLRRTPRR